MTLSVNPIKRHRTRGAGLVQVIASRRSEPRWIVMDEKDNVLVIHSNGYLLGEGLASNYDLIDEVDNNA